MDTHGGTVVKLVLKGVVGTTLDSRKDTERVFQAAERQEEGHGEPPVW